jgi:hypothetical protein
VAVLVVVVAVVAAAAALICSGTFAVRNKQVSTYVQMQYLGRFTSQLLVSHILSVCLEP